MPKVLLKVTTALCFLLAGMNFSIAMYIGFDAGFVNLLTALMCIVAGISSILYDFC